MRRAKGGARPRLGRTTAPGTNEWRRERAIERIRTRFHRKSAESPHLSATRVRRTPPDPRPPRRVVVKRGAAPVYSTLSADGRTVKSFDGPGVPYAHKFTSVRSATGAATRGIATLGGVVATDLICWDHYFRRACVARRDGDDPKVPGSIPTAATPCGLCHHLGDVTTVCSVGYAARAWWAKR